MAAQSQLTGLGRLAGDGLEIKASRGGMEISIEMSQSLPWRVFTLDDPARLVVDFAELDWDGAETQEVIQRLDAVDDLRVGLFRPGWSRMVLTMAEPMAVAEAGMETSDTGAKVTLRLTATDAASFAAKAGAPESAVFKQGAAPVLTSAKNDGPLTIVLDPGHGGLDPGAERDGMREKDLMLTFARELKDVLLRSGDYAVVLTRDEDVFVPLEERVSIARAAGADLFLSLHADALAQGHATGATVYTLSQDASDVASLKLAERHNRADLLAGLDLSDTADEVALVLMDLARTETQPRADRLGDALVDGIQAATGSTHKNPRMKAGFSVLKAADIPSVLVELGFLSSKRDREKLADPAWRANAAAGIRNGIEAWAEADEAAAGRLRQ